MKDFVVRMIFVFASAALCMLAANAMNRVFEWNLDREGELILGCAAYALIAAQTLLSKYDEVMW